MRSTKEERFLIFWVACYRVGSLCTQAKADPCFFVPWFTFSAPFWMTSQFQALSFCLVLRCLSDVLEGSSFIAVWSVSYFVMLLKNFVGVIYQSLRKVCATSGPCTSTRSRFVLNGSPCLIELTRCGRKSNQPSSVAWPLCQLTRCGHKTNQPSSVAWWPLRCGLKRNELSRGARWPLSQLNCITNSAVLVTNKVKLAVHQDVTILSVRSGTQNPFESLITESKNCTAMLVSICTACSEYSLESSINFEKGELLKETMNWRRKRDRETSRIPLKRILKVLNKKI